MKFLFGILLISLTSYAHAFTVYEITEPDGFPDFAPNEHILTWGETNVLGDAANVSYSFADSNYTCHDSITCFSLDSFMPSGYQDIITSAFDTWASATNLTFTEVNDQSGDIVLGGESIDGAGNVLAHSLTSYTVSHNTVESISYISSNGIHFDDAETWSIDGSPETGEFDLFTIALHEIGHSLGLGHTDDINALMYPYYSGVNTLNTDDINGIQYLYGVSAVPEPSTYLLLLLGITLVAGFGRKKIIR